MPTSNADADGPTFDPDRIISTLARHGVKFVIVGGVAARHYGASRATKDLDCLARFERDNLDRLAAAMRELGARLRVEGMGDRESIELTAHLPSHEFFERDHLTTWMTDAGPLDILRDIPDRHGELLSYEQLIGRASNVAYPGGVTMTVAALADIVASKEYANRPKDHEALPELRALLDDGAD